MRTVYRVVVWLQEGRFPARDGVRKAGGPSDHEDRRVVGGCPGGAEQRWIAHEHDRPGRRVDLLAVDREDRVSAHHGEQLLMAVRLVLFVVGLVMLFDHLVAGVSGRGVDAKRPDVEMATDEMER